MKKILVSIFLGLLISCSSGIDEKKSLDTYKIESVDVAVTSDTATITITTNTNTMCSISIDGMGTQVKDDSDIHIFELKDLIDGSEYGMTIELSTPSGATIGGNKIIDDSYKFYTHVGDIAIVLFRSIENYNSIDIEVSANKEANVKMVLNGETYTGIGKDHNTSFSGLVKNTNYILSVDLSITDGYYGTTKTHSEEYTLKTKNADEFIMNHSYSTTINSAIINVSSSYLIDVELRIVGGSIDQTVTKTDGTLHVFNFTSLDDNTDYTIYLKGTSKEGLYIGDVLNENFTIKTVRDIDSEYFITKWNMAPFLTLKIPLDASGTYDFDIDWGDGIIEHYTNNNVVHTYSDIGVYIVKILGTIEGFGFDQAQVNSSHNSLLLDILQFGTVKLHNNGYQFNQCDSLYSFSASDSLYFENITNMTGMFAGDFNFNGDLTCMDTSNVTTMESTFEFCNEFNKSLSTFNTSSVLSTKRMFYGAEKFNRDLGMLDFSKVTDMSSMFCYSFKFNGTMPNNFSSVTTMYQMYYKAVDFTQDLNSITVNPGAIQTNMFTDSGLDGNEPSWYIP